MPAISEISQFVSNFAEPGYPDYAPPVQKGETPVERRTRSHQIRLEEGAKKAAEELQKYDPNSDPSVSGDPYKTLFVARLSYETTERRIKREFEAYGPIKRAVKKCFNDSEDILVRLVTDRESNKPRGYAFIEYVHTRDMKAAYKQADGKKIDYRRVLVDVECGRTVPNWQPRHFGGGLGTTRIGSEDSRQLGREQMQSGGISGSEEPRVEQERDREKSREWEGRGRDLMSRIERSRDRDHRDDKHHRDSDRDRKKDRESDRTHDRGRERVCDRDHEHERDRDCYRLGEREMERDKDYEYGDHDRGRSHDRGYD